MAKDIEKKLDIKVEVQSDIISQEILEKANPNKLAIGQIFLCGGCRNSSFKVRASYDRKFNHVVKLECSNCKGYLGKVIVAKDIKIIV